MTEGKRFTLKSPHGKEAAKEVLCVGRVSDLWGKQGLRFPLRLESTRIHILLGVPRLNIAEPNAGNISMEVFWNILSCLAFWFYLQLDRRPTHL